MTTYYVSTTGDDGNDGLSPGNAFATVQKGCDSLSPGDDVQVAAGTYYEKLVLTTQGTSGNLCVLQGEVDGDGNPLTIIDPTEDIASFGTWVPAPEIGPSAGVYKMPFTTFEPAWMTNNGRTIYKIHPNNMVRDDGSINDGFTRLGMDRNTTTDYPNAGDTYKLWDASQAMFGWRDNVLYVRFRDNRNPNNESLRVERPTGDTFAPVMECSAVAYWEVRNLTIRGGRTGINVIQTQSSNFDIHDNVFLSCGKAIQIYAEGGGHTIHNNRVDWNQWTDGQQPTVLPGATFENIDDYNTNLCAGVYRDHKQFFTDGSTEVMGLWLQSWGAGTTIYDNTFSNGVEGIECFATSATGDPLEIRNNRIENICSVGMLVGAGLDNADIHNNEINNCSFSFRYHALRQDTGRNARVHHNKCANQNHAGAGIFMNVQDSGGDNPTVTFENNLFSGHGVGVDFNNAGNGAAALSGTTIDGNTFSSLSLIKTGIVQAGDEPASYDRNWMGGAWPSGWPESWVGPNNVDAEGERYWPYSTDAKDLTLATYTIGSSGQYATYGAFVAALNAGSIGAAGEDVVAEWVSDTTETGQHDVTNSAINSLTLDGKGFKITISGLANIFHFSIAAPVVINDLELDCSSASHSGFGQEIVNFTGSLTMNRCWVHDLSSTYFAQVCYVTTASASLTLNSCVFSNFSSTYASGIRLIWANNASAMEVNGCVFDNISTSQNAAVSALYGGSSFTGTDAFTVRNSAFTRLTSNGGSTNSWLFGGTPTETIETTATFDSLGTITGIDETEFVDASSQNYQLRYSSQLIDAGTTIPSADAAITIDGFDRSADTSRDPWDIGAYERTKVITIGPGGDVANLNELRLALNAGDVGSTGEHVVATVIGDYDEERGGNLTNTDMASLTINGNKHTATVRLNFIPQIFRIQTSAPIVLNDFILDCFQAFVTTDFGGTPFYLDGGTANPNFTANRCWFKNLRSASRGSYIISLVGSGATCTVNSSIFSGNQWSGAGLSSFVYFAITGTYNFNGCVFDNGAQSSTADAIGIDRAAGTVNITNCTFTRITAAGGTPASWNGAVTNTTNATFDNLGTITGIDETVFADADAGDYTPADSGQPIVGTGTTLTGDAAVDYNGNIRTPPFDIGAVELSLGPDPPVSWNVFVAGNLRICWHDGQGNLKPSCTTAQYSGGDPTSPQDLKPSIVDYDTGYLKSGLTLGGDLKPSMKPAKTQP